MAEHIWTVLCGKTQVDRKTEVLSLIDALETIVSEGLEQRLEDAARIGKTGAALNVEMQLVSWWWRSDPKEAALHVRFLFLNPVGETLFSQEGRMQWAPDSTAWRLFVDIPRLPIGRLGLHWFAVEQYKEGKKKPQWVRVTKIPLNIESASYASTEPEPLSEPTPSALLESS